MSKIDCIYCDEPFEDIIKYEYVGYNRPTNEYIFVGLDSQNYLNVTASAGVYEPNFLESNRKINYCPMCGRKLGENDDKN